MLTIIFVTNNYKPYQGGVVSSIITHAQQLRELGHQVTIITLDFDPSLPHEEHVIRLYCPLRFSYKKNALAIPWKAVKTLTSLFITLKPDIIHCHHPFLLARNALKVARKLHIPVVFTYHTLYEYYLHNIPLPRILTQPVMNFFIKRFCKNVDGIIVPSKSVYNKVVTFIKKNNIEIIPSAIHPIYFQPCQKTLQQPLRLLTVSRFTKEKNIPFLLEVIKRLTIEFEFTLVGYGTEYKNLQKYAYDLLKLSKIMCTFVHKPTKDYLLQLYQQAHLFLFASQSETQGLVIVEAMAQKNPVIALNGPGVCDVVVNDYNGYLVTSHQEMQEKIEKVMHNAQLYEQLHGQASITAQNYQSLFITQKMISFYEKFIN